jgi:hypothetical protein
VAALKVSDNDADLVNRESLAVMANKYSRMVKVGIIASKLANPFSFDLVLIGLLHADF